MKSILIILMSLTAAGAGYYFWFQKSNVNEYTISKEERDKTLKNLPEILSSARGILIKKEDKTINVKLVDIQPGGFVHKMGLKDNDILTKVNGKSFTVTSLMGMFSTIKTANLITLNILRDEKDIIFKIIFE